MRRNLLLIDSDQKEVSLLRTYLVKFDFEIASAANHAEALKHLSLNQVDIILVLGMNEIEICREIRKSSDVPMIIVSGRNDPTDRTIGLEVGADDYVGVPYDQRELVARVRAVLRRPRHIEKRRTLRFEGLEINLKDRKVFLNGKELELTTMEFEVLTLLAEKPGEVFSRDDIMEFLRGVEADVFSRSIDVILSRLRSKLRDDAKKPRYIKTVWGAGYAFIGRPSTTEKLSA